MGRTAPMRSRVIRLAQLRRFMCVQSDRREAMAYSLKIFPEYPAKTFRPDLSSREARSALRRMPRNFPRSPRKHA